VEWIVLHETSVENRDQQVGVKPVVHLSALESLRNKEVIDSYICSSLFDKNSGRKRNGTMRSELLQGHTLGQLSLEELSGPLQALGLIERSAAVKQCHVCGIVK
jgi:hypothetical protein